MTQHSALEGVAWWAAHVGRHLTPDGKAPEGAALFVPTRAKAGVKDMRLGAISAYYAATETVAHVVGRLEIPSGPGFHNHAVEAGSAARFVARWLVQEASGTFMTGVITKSNPERYMVVSRPGCPAVFCSAGENLFIDLSRLRAAEEAFSGLPWKKVTQAIYLARDARAGGVLATSARERYAKLCKGVPGLAQAISAVDIPAGGGEHRVLGWLNIEDKAGTPATTSQEA